MFLAVLGVQGYVRPVQAFGVDEAIVGTARCHTKPSLFRKASMVQLLRIKFRDDLTPQVR